MLFLHVEILIDIPDARQTSEYHPELIDNNNDDAYMYIPYVKAIPLVGQADMTGTSQPIIYPIHQRVNMRGTSRTCSQSGDRCSVENGTS